MSKARSADTRILSVSIVAGSSSDGLLQKIDANKEERRLVLPANAISPQGHGHDALEQIRTIAERGDVDHLIIECDSETPAMAYASLLSAPPFTEIARLTATILAISPTALLDALTNQRPAVKLASPCLLAEQLEFVGNIVFDGSQDGPDFKLARAIAITLNPRAQISDLSSETVERLLEGTGPSFDFAEALDGAGWRKLIDANESVPGGQDNITAFAYRARRPFHPERFWNLLQKELPGVFRAKGFFWLATRMDLVGGLNLADSELHCAAAGQWWATREEHTRQSEMPEHTRKEWEEPFGDRRQAIAFMGIDFDADAFRAELDACLLTDSEMAAGKESWHTLSDPFPSWSGHSHEHECDHDHGSGEHDCCHH